MTNIGGSDGNSGRFLSDLLKRIIRLENSLGIIGAKIVRTVDAKQQVFVGPDDPLPRLAPGTLYVWYRVSSDGTLIDTVVGRA